MRCYETAGVETTGHIHLPAFKRTIEADFGPCEIKTFRVPRDETQPVIETNLLEWEESSLVADIGAGTGILSRHFAGKVGHLYAIEPNSEMRALMENHLASLPGWSSLGVCAEETTLPDQSIDLITVATAIHWFDPEPTRREFMRIVKPGGWLAVLRNYNTDTDMNLAIRDIFIAENGAAEHAVGAAVVKPPISFFYGKTEAARYTFPFSFQQNWETFIGAMITQSNAPDQDHPLFHHFEAAARELFDRFSCNGSMEIHGETELYLDQITQPNQQGGI
jgi:ubiquinone/menaquinone biosynthesis C-methylase UbiE